MKRLKKAAPFIALAVVVVMIPVLATTFSNNGTTTAPSATSDVSLDLVLLVNRMELTKDEMQALHDVLVDLAGQREALETALEEKRIAFETEMLAFSGTSDELDARLEAHRTEIRTLVESTRDAAVAAYEKVGDLLTYNQGMLLEQVLPRLDGSLAGDLRGWVGSPEMSQGARLRFMMQGLARAFGEPGNDSTSAEEGRGRAGRGQAGPQRGIEAGQAPNPLQIGNGRGLGLGSMRGQTASGVSPRQVEAMPQGANGPRVLEELIRVLELKLGQS
ncbi:MAG: hypothetical protein PHU43_03030 [Candidatus Bipolaricaulis sp.]|nr:hypothetical protein [Candidatus Bipolaricaulis sp.]